MTATLLTFPVFRAFDSNGAPLAGGLLYSYQAGTTTPLATYVDQAGVTQNTNPVVLDSTGTANVWLGDSTYKLVLKDSEGVQQWSVDNIQSEQAVVNGVYTNLANTSDVSKGDALIGVKQPLTGSVATTQHEFNSRTINIFDFMTAAQIADVKAFGFTEDITSCIETAMASLGTPHGGTIFFPRGGYRLTDSILFPSNNITLKGEESSDSYAGYGTAWYQSHAATYFKWTACAKGNAVDFFPDYSAAISTDNAKKYRNFCRVENIYLDGNGVVTTGIRYAGVHTLKNVTAYNCGIGLYVTDNMLSGWFENCNFAQNNQWGIKFNGVLATITEFNPDIQDNTICTFLRCRISENGAENTGGGLYVENDRRALFMSCTFEQNYSNAVYLTNVSGIGGAETTGITFLNCWFEQNGGTSTGDNLYAVYSTFSSGAYPPRQIKFQSCNWSAAESQRYVKIAYGDNWTFEQCYFGGGDQANGISLDATNATNIKFVGRLQSTAAPQSDDALLAMNGKTQLDPYGVHSWTPVLNGFTLGAPSTTTATGYWTRSGNIIKVWCSIEGTGGTTIASVGNGTSYITGLSDLPFYSLLTNGQPVIVSNSGVATNLTVGSYQSGQIITPAWTGQTWAYYLTFDCIVA